MLLAVFLDQALDLGGGDALLHAGERADVEDARDAGIAVGLDQLAHEVVGDPGAQGRFALNVAVALMVALEGLDDLHRMRQDVPTGEHLVERLGQPGGHSRHETAFQRRLAHFGRRGEGPPPVERPQPQRRIAPGVAQIHAVDVQQPIRDRIAHDLKLLIFQPLDHVVRVGIVLSHIDLADVEHQREPLVVGELGRPERRDGLGAPSDERLGLGPGRHDLIERLEPGLLEGLHLRLVGGIRTEAPQDVLEKVRGVDPLEEDLLHLDLVAGPKAAGHRDVNVVRFRGRPDHRHFLQTFQAHEFAQHLGVLAEPARPARRRQHHQVLLLYRALAAALNPLLEEPDRISHHTLEWMADLRIDVLTSHFVATRGIGGQDLTVDTEVPQAGRRHVAGVTHVRQQPRSSVVGVRRIGLETFHIQSHRAALADHPFVGFGARHKRGIVRLGVRQQDQQRFVHHLLDPLLLVHLQAVRAAGKVHHANGEQIRMVRHKKAGLEDPDALDPELVFHEHVDWDVFEAVLEELLRDVVEASDLGEHSAGIGTGLGVEQDVVSTDSDVGREIVSFDAPEEAVTVGIQVRLKLTLRLVGVGDGVFDPAWRESKTQPGELPLDLPNEQGLVAKMKDWVDLLVLVQREHIIEDVPFRLGVNAVLQVRRVRLSLLDEARIEKVLDVWVAVEDGGMAGGQFSRDAKFRARIIDADLGNLLVAAR